MERWGRAGKRRRAANSGARRVSSLFNHDRFLAAHHAKLALESKSKEPFLATDIEQMLYEIGLNVVP